MIKLNPNTLYLILARNLGSPFNQPTNRDKDVTFLASFMVEVTPENYITSPFYLFEEHQ
ncbi:hypothetical protein [Desulfocastanea catecholica]